MMVVLVVGWWWLWLVVCSLLTVLTVWFGSGCAIASRYVFCDAHKKTPISC